MMRATCLVLISGLFILHGPPALANDASRYIRALGNGNVSEAVTLERSAIDDLDALARAASPDHVDHLSQMQRRLADAPRGALSGIEASIARVFCRIDSYDLDDEQSRSLRAELRTRFVENWDAYTDNGLEADSVSYYETARFLDCANHNAADSYFGVIEPQASQVFPSGRCTTHEHPRLQDVERFAADLNRVADAAARGGRSFYWPRARLEGARADVAAILTRLRNGDIGIAEARGSIGAVGDTLLDTAEDPRLITARNGWRLANDIAYHGALYRLVGPDDPEGLAHLRARKWLTELADTIPVLSDERFATAVEPWIRDRIREDDAGYRDPILVGRLFPGLLADPADDCARNRQQSLDPIDLGQGTLSCLSETGRAEGVPGPDRDSLLALDACLLGIESEVWWVQLGAFRQQDSADTERDRFDAAFRRATESGLEEGLDFDPAPKTVPPDATTQFYRVRTSDTLTRRQAGALSDFAEERGFGVLIGRQTIW